MSRALIRYERGEDGVAVITLDDPPANAYSYEMMKHTPKLVIAALNGHCVGGGLEVALAADKQLFESEDAREGIAAHLEKRKPAFKGR